MLEQIQNLPDRPGVYHYYDAGGHLLYVGKAKSLKKRVKSYFRFTPVLAPNPTLSPRIRKMLGETVSLNYIVVESEHDALILENSLIKQLKPKYNILLRDDKTYPYIYINRALPFPRFEITRKVVTGSRIEYFGPYSVGARDILDSLYDLVPLVQKQSCLSGGKTCLFYQMKQCLGPCEGLVTPEAYAGLIDEAKGLIDSKRKLLSRLEERMAFYAEALRFEEAAKLRDRIDRIERSEQLSKIDLANAADYDIFAVAHNDRYAAIVRLFMRRGKIVSSAFDTIRTGALFDPGELYERTLLEFYVHDQPPIVAPILVADDFETRDWVASALSKHLGRKVEIHAPQRGEKRKVIDTARLNAEELLKKQRHTGAEATAEAVQALCGLSAFPERVEVFDNSHLAGVAPVGAMIVSEKGTFLKKAYRHYNLDARDEYAQMREMLTRRIESFGANPPPDLWIIDGGRTLLLLATDLLASAGVNLDVIAVSKEKIDAKAHRAKGKAADLIHTAEETLRLPTSDPRLHWVQRLRDEAHRFAITFHKKQREKEAKSSNLLQLKGISEAKIKKLLNHYGTFEAVYAAPEEELAALLNIADAKIIKNSYR
ncbi:excinuclease ABC subunit UvrC [Sulfurimonas sp. HSL-1656]|uniref:excinuclease ABC subunit UvrC n=1 Tax=Thiomicrolovo subterrani TaxID=3131934 RepID=UPI0031F9D02C